jgi:Na+/H+-dicarboxylate symporter
MLDTLFSSIIPDSLTPGSMLSALFASLALGFAISLFYRKTRGYEEEASGFAVR